MRDRELACLLSLLRTWPKKLVLLMPGTLSPSVARRLRGKYDQTYLDYVVRLLRVLKEASLRVCEFALSRFSTSLPSAEGSLLSKSSILIKTVYAFHRC